MTVQFATDVRNAQANAVESTIGTTPVLKFFTGAQPANCAAANSGTELASITLPSDWLGAAASGAVAMVGTWDDAIAETGTAAHFRVYASDGTTCKIQGSVTTSGGGGDMTVTTTSFVEAQPIEVLTFTLTQGGA